MKETVWNVQNNIGGHAKAKSSNFQDDLPVIWENPKAHVFPNILRKAPHFKIRDFQIC